MPELTIADWSLLLIGATTVGISKSGLAGISMVQVIIFAFVFGARSSTGILLPLLVVGDLCAVWLVGRDVLWNYVRRLLPAAFVGIVCGWILLDLLDENAFRPIIGCIILLLSIGQSIRMWRPELFENIPHSRWFAWTMGTLSGITTMLANAAGPLVSLYLLAISLPKPQLIATSAWFFLIINASKIPFSMQLGLIDQSTLILNGVLAPCVLIGLLGGRWLISKIHQRTFDTLLLVLTAIAAIRLIVS